MTNKIIDGVPRTALDEALELLAAHDSGGGSREGFVAQELRAILDKEVDGDFCAPEQQMEVVAWRHTLHFEEGCGSHSEFTNSPTHPFGKPDIDYSKTFLVTTDPLYAEQSAPVAFKPDTVVCRHYTLDQSPGQNFYHLDLKPVYGSVPVTLQELITMAESTPVAVVMPDDWEDQMFAEMSRRFDLRKSNVSHMVYDDTQIGVEFARDWIKAKLNEVKL